jgi:hypothetical protein
MDTPRLATPGLFEHEVKLRSPIVLLPNGFISYHEYLIGELDNGNWGIYNTVTNEPIDQFYLRCSALIAAKSHKDINIQSFYTIKQLDRKYWASFHNTILFKQRITGKLDYDHYLIIMDRLEDSVIQQTTHKDKIIKMFKATFR